MFAKKGLDARTCHYRWSLQVSGSRQVLLSFLRCSKIKCRSLCGTSLPVFLLQISTMYQSVNTRDTEMVFDPTRGPPPPYESIDSLLPKTAPTGSKWNPKNWSKITLLAVVVAVVVIIAAIIVGAVVGTKENAYPDYSPLNYTLEDTYSGTDFFDNFDYFTGYDPSAGYVHYVDSSVATSQQYNLTYASSWSAVLKVDTTDTNADTGRYSVRITSKKQYNNGLFVFDILNSPYGCSTWPALWTSDPSNWPENGKTAPTFVQCFHSDENRRDRCRRSCEPSRRRKPSNPAHNGWLHYGR